MSPPPAYKVGGFYCGGVTMERKQTGRDGKMIKGGYKFLCCATINKDIYIFTTGANSAHLEDCHMA